MFARFLSWLGLDKGPDSQGGAVRAPQRRSATGHLYQKKPVAAAPKSQMSKANDDFNPYNTGKFDRSASWEKISKSQR